MRDLRKGQTVITISEVKPIPKGRIGLVNEFKRNPKNDAIEVLQVCFGLDNTGVPILVNIEDVQTIDRFSVE